MTCGDEEWSGSQVLAGEVGCGLGCVLLGVAVGS
jgi:hypothetical protein